MPLSKEQAQAAFDASTAPAREERMRQAAVREPRNPFTPLAFRKRRLDRVAYAFAVVLTLASAFFIAWWYGLDRSVIFHNAFLFFGMFASAVGAPAYYVLRYARARRANQLK